MLGRLPSLTTLTLCGQMMHSVESARMVLALGRMLPELDVSLQPGVVCTNRRTSAQSVQGQCDRPRTRPWGNALARSFQLHRRLLFGAVFGQN